MTVNAYGTPLYRNCTASILYKSKNGETRILKGVDVQEDYEGSNYGKPYFNARLQHFFLASPGQLNSMHYPVPYSKVK